MNAYACCRISSRRQSHSLLSVMRVPSIFVNGSGSLEFGLSESTLGMAGTVQPVLGFSTSPQSPLPPVGLPVVPVVSVVLVAPPAPVVVGSPVVELPPPPVVGPAPVVEVPAPVVAVIPPL